MKKTLIILALLLTGCSRIEEVNKELEEDEGRFGIERIYTRTSENIVLVCDSELHVEYMFIAAGGGVGLTVRYNALGEPKECDY